MGERRRGCETALSVSFEETARGVRSSRWSHLFIQRDEKASGANLSRREINLSEAGERG